jgi:hypothetical protein
VTQNFAQVTDYMSDLQSHSTQFSFGVSPIAFNSSLQWNVTYIWQKVVDKTRGFGGGTTAGDPYLTQWARGDRDARHQITYTVGYNWNQVFSITAFGRVQSGNPFTTDSCRRCEWRWLQQRSRVCLQPAATIDRRSRRP